MILYVDDDPDDTEVFQDAVSAVAPKRKCIISRNGKDALTILRAGILPSYIFLDINMPLLNGHQTLREIRKMKECNDIKVIMYSTSDSQLDKERAKSNGANDYIVKPGTFKELCTVLNKLLNEV